MEVAHDIIEKDKAIAEVIDIQQYLRYDEEEEIRLSSLLIDDLKDVKKVFEKSDLLPYLIDSL